MREDSPSPKLLSGLTPQQREIALQRAERRDFAPNEVIVNIGKPATRLFQLTKGTAKYYRVTKTGDEVVLWWLASEDILGVGALLAEPWRYIGTAQAVEGCEVLVWKRENIRSMREIYETMTANALHIALNALAGYTDRIVGVTTETAEQRLRRTLLDLARRTGTVGPKGVDVTITNEDLGNLANVSMFTTSRLMKKWERQGVLEKGRGRLRVFSPENLFTAEV
jgi:CRP/FNR family transcriptional regulator